MDKEKLIIELEKMYKESDENSKNSAMGYDEGFYNGECNAISEILELVKSFKK